MHGYLDEQMKNVKTSLFGEFEELREKLSEKRKREQEQAQTV